MLTHKGFKLNYDSLSDNEKKKIMSDLTIQPEPYIGIEQPYKIYTANDKDVYLPRYYGVVHYGNNNVRTCKNILFPGEKIKFNFTISNFKLRPAQQEAFKHIVLAFKQYGSAILKLDCGVGKTVLGIYLSQKISRKTLVVVHRVNLLTQWKNEIEQYTDAKVGLLHRKTIDIENKDIVLTTVHNVINKGSELSNLYKRFSLSIFDEAHHLSAREFCQTLKHISTKLMLGLTATPNKGDILKINRVFKSFLGPIVPPDNVMSKFKTKNANQGNVIVNMVRYKVDDPLLSTHLIIEYAGKPNTASMITNISKNNNRSDVIVKLIEDICSSYMNLAILAKFGIFPLEVCEYIKKYTKHLDCNSERKILIVSDRKYQLKYIHRQLCGSGLSAGLFIGGMTPSELEKSKQKKVILGTYAICEEGLNIKDLNMLIVATPRRECEQMVGRILRKQHSIPVIILDMIDHFSPTFVRQSYARKKFYKSKKYVINMHDVVNLTDLPTLNYKL